MQVFALTDIHGVIKSAKRAAGEAYRLKADIITVSGDITNFEGEEKAKEILSALRESSLPVLYVPGNCDGPEVFNLSVEGCYCLHGQLHTFRGYSFVGLGGSNPTPMGTLTEFEEEEISKILEKASSSNQNIERLILVSHPPPLETNLDSILGSYGEPRHVGSQAVRSFVEEKKPILVLCGHIHDARGVDKLDGSVLVNPGTAKAGNFALITLNGKVETNLDSFSSHSIGGAEEKVKG